MMFYRKLLEFSNLSISDKIIYSFLTYKAISNIEDIYDVDGYFNQYVLTNTFDNGDYWQELEDVSIRKIAKFTNLSIAQCSRSINELQRVDLVSIGHDNSYNVFLYKDVVMQYGFDVDVLKDKPSILSVFYYFLKDKAIKYGGRIDTWDTKLAKEYNTTLNNIRIMVTRLKKKGLVERTEDNKLKIN